MGVCQLGFIIEALRSPTMDYQKICDEIIKLDNKIRYVATYDYGELHEKTRPNLKSYLTREETETSLSQAVYRWSTRKKTSEKIGKPVYALAKYEKIYRITVPIAGAGLILVSTDIDADIMSLLDKLFEYTSKFSEE